MYYPLVHLLTGRSSGYSIFSELNTFDNLGNDDPVLTLARETIGTEDEYWAYVVYHIVTDAPEFLFFSPEDPKNIELDGRRIAIIGNDKLVSDAQGPALLLPVDPSIAPSNFEKQASVTYNPAQKLAVISFGGNVWRVDARFSQDRIYVDWPKELGVRGALLGSNTTATFTLNVRSTYPTSLVVQRIGDNEQLYNLLEKGDMTSSFFFGDSDKEKLATFVRAMQLYNQTING